MAKLLIPKEIAKGERRVAAVPETIKRYVKAGIECVVEAGAGEWANVEDDAYRAAGASIAGDAAKAWSEAGDGGVEGGSARPDSTRGRQLPR